MKEAPKPIDLVDNKGTSIEELESTILEVKVGE
jgi:hypothetical protein